jgi:hypothetical protein
MSGRPCNPGSDLRQLWRALLGDMPFPQCGVPEQEKAPEVKGAAPSGKQPRERENAASGQRNR